MKLLKRRINFRLEASNRCQCGRKAALADPFVLGALCAQHWNSQSLCNPLHLAKKRTMPEVAVNNFRIFAIALLVAASVAPQAVSAQACSGSEKRWHDKDCIPKSLWYYLFCVENIAGGGIADVKSALNSDNSKSFTVDLNGGASTLVISGQAGFGLSKVDMNRIESSVQRTYSTTVAQGCQNKWSNGGPPPPPPIPNKAIPDIGGHEFSRDRSSETASEVPGGHVAQCMVFTSTQETLEFDSGQNLKLITGHYQLLVLSRRKLRTESSVFCAYSSPQCYRDMAACEIQIAPYVAARSLIEVTSNPTELRYRETVERVDPNYATVTPKKEGKIYSGRLDVTSDLEAVTFDRRTVYRAN